MTIYTQVVDVVPRAHYAANGIQTAFPYTFPVFDPADLEVWIDQAKQAPSAYSVSGIGVAVGGSVLFSAPPEQGARVTLRRRMPLESRTEFPDTAVQAKPLNDVLNYHVAVVQQVADDVGLAVKRSFRSLSSADLTLPEPESGKAIKWNAAGTGLENSAADADEVAASARIQADAAAVSAAGALAAQAAATTQANGAAQSRLASDADSVATAADRVATHADRLAAGASAAAAQASELAAASAAAGTAADASVCSADAATATAQAGVAATQAANAAASAANASASAASVSASAGSAATQASNAAASAGAAHASEAAAATSAAIAAAVSSGGAVKVSATDTTANYLSSTLSAGPNITLTVMNSGADETLRIGVSGLAAVAGTGTYSDLAGKPSLGSAAALNAGAASPNLPNVAALHAMAAALSF